MFQCCTASAGICLLAKRRWRPMRRGPDWCGIKGRLEPKMTTDGLGGGGRMGTDSCGRRLGVSSCSPAREETKQPDGPNSPAGWGKTGHEQDPRRCRQCQTADGLVRWIGDRPSARCVPSHDRHDLMNITEAVPGCQSQILSSEVTSQYAPKSQLSRKLPVGQKPARARPGDGMEPRQARQGSRDDREGDHWRSCLLNLSLTPTSPPPRASHWWPNSHRSCRSASKKGKSRSDQSPRSRLD